MAAYPPTSSLYPKKSTTGDDPNAGRKSLGETFRPQGAYGTGASLWTHQNEAPLNPALAGLTDTSGLNGLPNMSQFWGRFNSQGNTPPFNLPPHVSRVSGPTFQQEEAARGAAQTRAREQSNSIASSALSALRGELQRRGMGGAGYEAGRIGEELVRAANPQVQLLEQMTQNDLNRATHIADVEYEGQVGQRGTDIGATATHDALAQRTREADLNAILSALRLLRY